MDITEFINKTMGRKVDFDGHYGAQCVDLFRQYIWDVKGIPHTGGVIGAKDLWLNYERLPKEVEHLERHKLDEAECGDVVIWGATKTNPYGHVAIYISRIGEHLLVYEQDGFRQDGAKFATRKSDNILGLLRSRR